MPNVTHTNVCMQEDEHARVHVGLVSFKNSEFYEIDFTFCPGHSFRFTMSPAQFVDIRGQLLAGLVAPKKLSVW